MTNFQAGGHQLEYIWLGPAPDQAPTIVFLHEGLGCVAMWRDFPQQVVEATGCGALVYSRAGYGNSEPITLPRQVSFMHDEALKVLPEVIEKLNLRDVILFGHSDGGSIALIFAGSGNATKVRGLILEAPHVFVEDLSVESIKSARDNYDKGSLQAGLARYHGNNVDCAFRGWNDIWLAPEFRAWNIESYLPNIKVPVLVIQGEEDQYGTPKQIEAIENQCGGIVTTVVIPNCGHSPHRDQTQMVLNYVTGFLNEITEIQAGIL